VTPEVVDGKVTDSHFKECDQIVEMIEKHKAALEMPQLSVKELKAVSALRIEISK
jgi:hypothetical protein